MIATVEYKLTGNEPIEAGETVVYIHPASGYEIIDVIIDGLSRDFETLTIDETTGKIAGAGITSWVRCTYKTLPRNNVTASATMTDFSETDFVSSDFT